MTPVQTLGSPKVVLLMLAISALIPTTALPLWQKELVTTGTQYWLNTDSTKPSDIWVTMSQFLPELCVACAMLLMVTVLLATRRMELRKCWKAHWRIKYYFGLTCIAIAVNFAIGIGGLLWIVWMRDTRLIVVGWSMRHVHIALDTLVLYGVLVKPSVWPRKSTVADVEENREVTSGPAFELSNSTPASQPFKCTASHKAAAPTHGPDVDSYIACAAKALFAHPDDVTPVSAGLGVNCKCVDCDNGTGGVWPSFKGEMKAEETVVDSLEETPALRVDELDEPLSGYSPC